MKRRFYLFALALLLCCTACGQKEPHLGLPTPAEIEELEAMYGLTRDELMRELHLSEEDLEIDRKEFLSFPAERTIAGLPVTETLFFVLSGEPYMGVWRFQFLIVLEDWETAGKTIVELYEEAVSLCGEPDTNPGMHNRIADRLDSIRENRIWAEEEAGIAEYVETWWVGKQTEMSMNVGRSPQGLVVYFRYGMLPVIP